MKIGVFDSGVGGITVLRELLKALPYAEYLYLGDTANLPYGTKSPIQVEKLSRDCARILKERGVDLVVVACNTASSLALQAIREELVGIPVFSVLEPGVQATAFHYEKLKSFNSFESFESLRSEDPFTSIPVLVLATKATVKSGAYGRQLRQRLSDATVIEQACPLLVPMIEEGWVGHKILDQTVSEYVALHTNSAKRPGIALLGCTHYPWIFSVFEKHLPGWIIVNSAAAVALTVSCSELFQKQRTPPFVKTVIEWIFTDPDAVPSIAQEFMQNSTHSLEKN